MSMSNASENAFLLLMLNNVAWATIGDASGLQPSAVAGSVYIALHTADPGEAGDQTTSEATYTGYGRIGVARSGAGWTVTGNSAANAGTIQFGECTAGTNNVTHFSVGTVGAGAGQIIFSGALSAARSISSGITPLFNPGALTGTVD